MTGSPQLTDADAFVRQHATWLVRLAYLLSGSREDALDLAQETCERLWRSWPVVSAADDPQAYVATIMANLQRSRWRRRRPHEVTYDAAVHVVDDEPRHPLVDHFGHRSYQCNSIHHGPDHGAYAGIPRSQSQCIGRTNQIHHRLPVQQLPLPSAMRSASSDSSRAATR